MMRLAFVLALFAFACAPASAHSTSHPSRSDDVTVVAEDDGRRVVLSPGDVLTVRLEAQFGTGYSWRVVSNNARRLKLLSSKVEYPTESSQSNREVQVFRFRATLRGAHTLRFSYVRSWMKNAPLKTFRLFVTVGRT